MRRPLDKLVNWLLSLAPWYRPAEIEARERHTEAVHKKSIRTRMRAERVLASYSRTHLHR